MRYIAVRWIHQHPEEPTELFSEISDDGMEVRKVERFRDGRAGFAARSRHSDGTLLSTEPLPSLAEIAQDPQFSPREIERAEFEAVWSRALELNAAERGPNNGR